MKKYMTLEKFEVKNRGGGNTYFDKGFIIEHDVLNNLLLVHIVEQDVLIEKDKLFLKEGFNIDELISNYKIREIESDNP